MRRLSEAEMAQRLKTFRVIGNIFGALMAVCSGVACFYVFLYWNNSLENSGASSFYAALFALCIEVLLAFFIIILLCIYAIYLHGVEKPLILRWLRRAHFAVLDYILLELLVFISAGNMQDKMINDSLWTTFFDLCLASAFILIALLIFHFIAINLRPKPQNSSL